MIQAKESTNHSQDPDENEDTRKIKVKEDASPKSVTLDDLNEDDSPLSEMQAIVNQELMNDAHLKTYQ